MTSDRIHPAGLNWLELRQTMELLFGCRNDFMSSKSRSIRRTFLSMRVPDTLEGIIPWPPITGTARRDWKTKIENLIFIYTFRLLKSEKLPLSLVRPFLTKNMPPRMKDFIKIFPREDIANFCLPKVDVGEPPRFPPQAPVPTRLIWAYAEFPYFGQRLRELRLQFVYSNRMGLTLLLRLLTAWIKQSHRAFEGY